MRRAAGIVGVVLAMGLAGLAPAAGPAAAQDLDAELADIAGDIAAVKSQINEASTQRTAVADSILEVDARLSVLVEDLRNTEADLNALQSEVDQRLEALAETREDLQGQYEALELTRFEGHLNTWQRRCHDAEAPPAVPAGVPAPDGGADKSGAHAGGTLTRV